MPNKIRQDYILDPIFSLLLPQINQKKPKSFLNLNIWNSFLHSQLANSQEHLEFTPTPVEDEATPLCAGTWLVLAPGAIGALPME